MELDDIVTDFLAYVGFISEVMECARVVDTDDGLITAVIYHCLFGHYDKMEVVTFPAYFLALDDYAAWREWNRFYSLYLKSIKSNN